MVISMGGGMGVEVGVCGRHPGRGRSVEGIGLPDARHGAGAVEEWMDRG